MHRWSRILALSLAISTILGAQSVGAVPVQVPYSGQLSEAGELVNGTRSMTFRICRNTACSGGDQLYTQTIAAVQVTNGAFSVLIGSDNALQSTVFKTAGLLLKVRVGTTDLGDVPLPFSPYAADTPDAVLRDGSRSMSNNLNLGGHDLTNGGAATFTSATLTGDLSVQGNMTFGNMSTDTSTFTSNIDALAGVDVTGNDLTVGGAKFTVDDATGNTSVAGTLGVTGAASLTGALDVGGAITAGSGNVAITDGTGKLAAFGSANYSSLNGSAFTNLDADALATGTVGLGRLSGITSTQLSGTAGITNAQVNDDLTISGGTINSTAIGGTTAAAGSFTTLGFSSTLTQTGTSQVTFTGNVNAQNGVDVTTAALTFNNAMTQSGSSQVTFTGNVDAASGVDISGAPLTLSGQNITGVGTSLTAAAGITLGTSANGSITLDANGTGVVNVSDNLNASSGVDITGAALTLGGQNITGVGTNLTAAAGITLGTTANGSITLDANGTGVVNVSDNLNASAGIDVSGAALTLGGQNITGVGTNLTGAGAVTLGTAANGNITLDANGTGVVNVSDNLNATAGLDVTTSPLTFSNALTQSGSSQVTFTGNVDAQNGLDVTTANLTVGGTNFTVAPASGNTSAAGTLTVSNAATVGTGDATDTITVNSGGGTNAVMSEGGIDRNSSSAETFAIQNSGTGVLTVQTEAVNVSGLTASELVTTDASKNLVSGGSATSTGSGNLVRATGPTVTTLTVSSGGAAITGTSSIAGTFSQTGAGNQVTFAGNVDANSGLDVTGNIGVSGLVDGIDVALHTHQIPVNASFVISGALTQAATRFAGPGVQAESATERNFMMCTSPGTITKLQVYANTAPGAGQTVDVTLRKNGVDETTLTAQVSGTGQSASDTASIACSAGERIAMKFVSSATAAAADISATLEMRYESAIP